MRWLTCALLGALEIAAFPASAQPVLPDRNSIDRWLAPLGAGSTFDASKGIDWGVMPGPFYTPELGIGVGVAAVGMYRPDKKDTVSQNSTLSISGYASDTGAFGLNFNNYAFFADDRWRFFLDGDIRNTPTYYWGRGFSAGEHNHDKQKYTSKALDVRPMLYRRLAESTYIGVGSALSVQDASNIKSGDPRRIESAVGGASVLSSGLSVALSWDNRDFVPNPRTGQTVSIRYTRYSPKIGSDTRFDTWSVHASRYHPLSQKSVLAWEVNGDFTQGHVPWNMLPLLGSNQRMRGYYEGRYRDRNAVSGQLEYRRKLAWRHGVVAWLGAGTMAPAVHELDNRRILPSAGVGYRFEFKPRMNVRLDYGVGKGSSGFYFQVGEAF